MTPREIVAGIALGYVLTAALASVCGSAYRVWRHRRTHVRPAPPATPGVIHLGIAGTLEEWTRVAAAVETVDAPLAAHIRAMLPPP